MCITTGNIYFALGNLACVSILIPITTCFIGKYFYNKNSILGRYLSKLIHSMSNCIFIKLNSLYLFRVVFMMKFIYNYLGFSMGVSRFRL